MFMSGVYFYYRIFGYGSLYVCLLVFIEALIGNLRNGDFLKENEKVMALVLGLYVRFSQMEINELIKSNIICIEKVQLYRSEFRSFSFLKK